MQQKIFIPIGLTVTNPYVYWTFHVPSNRLYVGCKYAKNSCNSSTLMTENGYKTSSKYIKKLIENTGLNSFIVIRIRHFITAIAAIKYEKRFLKKVNAKRNPKFINKNNGFGSFIGGTYTEEHKRKLKEASKNKQPVTDECKLKQSEALKGRLFSEDHKRKLKEAAKNRPRRSTEHSKKIGDTNKGRIISDESRKRMSDAAKNRPVRSAEHKKNNANANKGSKRNTESRKRMSDAQIGRRSWNDGITEKFVKVCPGEGWVLGRLKN